MGRETIPSGRHCQANVLALPKYLCKSQILSHFAAPLRSDNGSSRNAITAQTETHAGYGKTNNNTRNNGRQQGFGKRSQAAVVAKQMSWLILNISARGNACHTSLLRWVSSSGPRLPPAKLVSRAGQLVSVLRRLAPPAAPHTHSSTNHFIMYIHTFGPLHSCFARNGPNYM